MSARPRASITAFLIPAVALILGIAVRHERVSTVSLAGAAICLLGAAIVRNPQMLRVVPRYLGERLA